MIRYSYLLEDINIYKDINIFSRLLLRRRSSIRVQSRRTGGWNLTVKPQAALQRAQVASVANNAGVARAQLLWASSAAQRPEPKAQY